MKQIFDWLRDYIYRNTYKSDVEVITQEDALAMVDEAEAKWESDCCIRVIGKPFVSSCGQKYDKWTYVGEPYCANCGKPIKISEVE